MAFFRGTRTLKARTKKSGRRARKQARCARTRVRSHTATKK